MEQSGASAGLSGPELCVCSGQRGGGRGRRKTPRAGHVSPLSNSGVWGARAYAKRLALVIPCSLHVLLSLGHTGLTRPPAWFSLTSSTPGPPHLHLLRWRPLTLLTSRSVTCGCRCAACCCGHTIVLSCICAPWDNYFVVSGSSDV